MLEVKITICRSLIFVHFVSRWKIESSKASVSFGGTLHQTKVPAVFVVVKDDFTWPHESTLGVVVRVQHIVLDIVRFAPLCGEAALGCFFWGSFFLSCVLVGYAEVTHELLCTQVSC